MPKVTPTAIVLTWTDSTATAIEKFNAKGYDPKTKSTTFENAGIKFEDDWVTITTQDNREYSYPSDNIKRIKKVWPE